ncbi:MAG: choice-of-anchor L domain-containing protein [Bacteroidales bacterium]|nr:choice-of-anchor L domain-containing protein [Bacteroidales bacterium]
MKINLLSILIFFISILVFPFYSQAQVSVQSSSGKTPYDLVSNVLVGGGVAVSNVKFNGVSAALDASTGAQIGTFSNNLQGYPQLGFSSGLLIATGDISVAPGPNNIGSDEQTVYNSMTCPELDALISGWGTTYNPAVLEFDFTTTANHISFNYVFGSEEYPEYAGSSYNDVFGFFVTDMITNVTQNIALIPGTNLPVSINNVNASSYSQYYVSVPDYSNAIQYDAHTTPFVAQMNVVPCRMYHMKLAISNVSDANYGSAVFLEAKSFNAPAVGDLLTFDHPEDAFVVYGCNNAMLTFSIPEPLDYDTTLLLTYSGTAVNGVDFQQIPASITIPAGQVSASLPIIALPNYNHNDTVELIITYSNQLCDMQVGGEVVVKILNDNKIEIASQDVNSCSPVDSVGITLVDGEYSTITWSPTTNLSNSHSLTTALNSVIEMEVQYTVVAFDKYHCFSDTTTFHFKQGLAKADTIEAAICNGATYTEHGFNASTEGIHTLTIPTGFGCDSLLVLKLSILPSPHIIIKDTVCAGESYHDNGFDIPGTTEGKGGDYVYQQAFPMGNGCDSIVELQLFVVPVPQPAFTPAPEHILYTEGSTIIFTNHADMNALSGLDYTWTWDFGDGEVVEDNSQAVSHTYDTWGKYLVSLSLTVGDCSAEIKHFAYVEEPLIFPNVITPNDDGVNDAFIIGNLNPELPNELFIYDRWGKRVFHQKNYATYQKDGNVYNLEKGFNADKNSDGVYYYVFHYGGFDKTFEYHGSLTVIR